MLLLFLLLSWLSLVVDSQVGRTASDCSVGSKWTDTYIRFECFQGKGVKGVRAIGCVQTNDDTGVMINPGATFNEKYFTYSCSKSGKLVSYKIINCRDSTGKNLAVNENRTMADGSKFRCYKDQSGAIKLNQETIDGCLYDGVKYAVGKTWTEPIEFKGKIAGVVKLIGKGARMECKKVGAGFIGVFAGCVLSSGKTLYSGKFNTENKINVKCLLLSNGTVTMSVVEDKDLTCSLNKAEVKNGEKYTTPDGIDVYICIFGIMKKISCMIDGKPYGADSLVTINNKRIYCNKGPGYVDFGDLIGCTLPDGSVKPFYSSWIVGTEVHRCYFKCKKNVVTAYAAFWRCSFNGQAIAPYTVATDGKTYFKKCGKGAKGYYEMRDMTAVEITAFLSARKKGGISSEFGGVGGEGEGQSIAEQPSESKPQPSGSANSTIEKPLPTSPSGQCKDLFELCASLAPMCTKSPTSSTSATTELNLKEIVKKTKVTADQIKEVFQLMGFDSAEASNDKEEINEVIRGLIDIDSNDGEHCAGQSKKRRRPSCKKSDIFKNKVHELVVMVCPATCKSSNAVSVGKLQSIIKDLVTFYTSDCV